MGRRVPSCFETPRHGAWKTRVYAVQGAAPQHEGWRGQRGSLPGQRCELSWYRVHVWLLDRAKNQPPAVGNNRRPRSHCFRIVIYNECCNSNVSSERAVRRHPASGAALV